MFDLPRFALAKVALFAIAITHWRGGHRGAVQGM